LTFLLKSAISILRDLRSKPKKVFKMAIEQQALHDLLVESFPESDIEIIDLAGDGDHYKAVIASDQFTGKNRVQQHQMVYAALKGKMGGELHALALETKIKSN